MVSYKANYHTNEWFVTDSHGQSIIHGEMRWWMDFGFAEDQGWLSISSGMDTVESIRHEMERSNFKEVDPYALAKVSREKVE